MKKKLVLAVVGAVTAIGLAAVRQGRRAQAEAELWAEATDPVSPTQRRPTP